MSDQTEQGFWKRLGYCRFRTGLQDQMGFRLIFLDGDGVQVASAMSIFLGLSVFTFKVRIF